MESFLLLLNMTLQQGHQHVGVETQHQSPTQGLMYKKGGYSTLGLAWDGDHVLLPAPSWCPEGQGKAGPRLCSGCTCLRGKGRTAVEGEHCTRSFTQCPVVSTHTPFSRQILLSLPKMLISHQPAALPINERTN